jgi:hypothetical protein
MSCQKFVTHRRGQRPQNRRALIVSIALVAAGLSAERAGHLRLGQSRGVGMVERDTQETVKVRSWPSKTHGVAELDLDLLCADCDSSTASSTSSWPDSPGHGLLTVGCEPTVLPDRATRDSVTSPSDERRVGMTLLVASNTCFSIRAAGTRVTNPASDLRPLSKARETY